MKWITEKQIKAAAKKSHKAAIEMSKKHWMQVVTATKRELIDGYNKGLVDLWGTHCALCQRYSDGFGKCGKCILKDENTGCCREWETAVRYWDPDGNRRKYRAFQKDAKKMYERLCKL